MYANENIFVEGTVLLRDEISSSSITLIQLFRMNDSPPPRGEEKLIENSRSRDFFVPSSLSKYSFPFPDPSCRLLLRSCWTINPFAVEMPDERLRRTQEGAFFYVWAYAALNTGEGGKFLDFNPRFESETR